MSSARKAKKSITPAVELGAAIRSRRLAAGLSQEDLGFEADTHRTYIGAIERGEKAITVEKLVVLAVALDCSASQILKDCDL